MTEPVSATSSVLASTAVATATSAVLSRYLGPSEAELLLICLGAIIGASIGAIASPVRGWRATGLMLLAIIISLFLSAYRLPWLDILPPAIASCAIAFFATAPLVHAKHFQSFCERIGAGLAAIKTGSKKSADQEDAL